MVIEQLFSKILKNNIRKDIVLLLNLYNELNVTQISNLLNRSKATVGRHLKTMQEYGVLNSKEKESKRSINPLYYSMPANSGRMLELIKQEEIDSMKNSKEKIKKFKNSLSIAKVIYKLVEHAIKLIDPFFDHLDSKINEEDIQYLTRYLTWRRQLSVKHIVLAEDDIDEFWKLYEDFNTKLEALSNKKKKKEKTLLFVDSLLPLKEMLKHGGKQD